jgi:lysophospholipase L1-like esterase
VEYRRDANGLRGRYRDVTEVRLLAIGGSTTDERFVDERQTWAEVLSESFGRGGLTMPVANAGVDGHSTVGHLRSIDEWLTAVPGLKPSYVLAYIGINDAHVELHASYDDIAHRDAGRHVGAYIKDRSALYALYAAIRGNIIARRAKVAHHEMDWSTIAWREVERPMHVQPPNHDMQQRIDAYRERVLALIDRIRAWGAVPIVVTQHLGTYRLSGDRLIVVEGEGLADYVRQTTINRAALAACRAKRAVCIDLGSEIEFQAGDFYDRVHTTPAGSRRIGEFLYEKLKDQIPRH